MVRAGLDSCRANLNREASSSGTSRAVGELEPDRSLLAAVDRVHHVDRHDVRVRVPASGTSTDEAKKPRLRIRAGWNRDCATELTALFERVAHRFDSRQHHGDGLDVEVFVETGGASQVPGVEQDVPHHETVDSLVEPVTARMRIVKRPRRDFRVINDRLECIAKEWPSRKSVGR
jgi:hypothetical protein